MQATQTGLPATAETVQGFYGGARGLMFQTESTSRAVASELARMVKQYNNYNGVEVGDAIDMIDHYAQKALTRVTFRFGREYSPVLYIDFPSSQHRRYLTKMVKDRLQHAQADEIDNDGDRSIRVWWD